VWARACRLDGTALPSGVDEQAAEHGGAGVAPSAPLNTYWATTSPTPVSGLLPETCHKLRELGTKKI